MNVRQPVLPAIVCAIGLALSAQSTAITVVLTGQSMIRSDLRTTKPAAVPTIKALLNGEVIFTNLEAAVAEPGETIQEGRGFLTPGSAGRADGDGIQPAGTVEQPRLRSEGLRHPEYDA